MKKTLLIDGKPVKFKASNKVFDIYEEAFEGDLIKAVREVNKVANAQINDVHSDRATLETINYQVITNMIWSFAKNADKRIPPVDEWLEQFNEFPIFEIVNELHPQVIKIYNSKIKKMINKVNRMAAKL